MFTNQIKVFGLVVSSKPKFPQMMSKGRGVQPSFNHKWRLVESGLIINNDTSVRSDGIILLTLVTLPLRVFARLLILLWELPNSLGLFAETFSSMVFKPLQFISNIILFPLRLLVSILDSLPLLRYMVSVAEKVFLVWVLGSYTGYLSEFVPYIEGLLELNPLVCYLLFGLPFLSLLHVGTLRSLLSSLGVVFFSLNEFCNPELVFYCGLENRGISKNDEKQEKEEDSLFAPLSDTFSYNSMFSLSFDEVSAIVESDNSDKGFVKMSNVVKPYNLSTLEEGNGVYVFSTNMDTFLESAFKVLPEEEKWDLFRVLADRVVSAELDDAGFNLNRLVDTLRWGYNYDVTSSQYLKDLVEVYRSKGKTNETN